jgi:hypothetical protein
MLQNCEMKKSLALLSSLRMRSIRKHNKIIDNGVPTSTARHRLRFFRFSNMDGIDLNSLEERHKTVSRLTEWIYLHALKN